VAGYYDSGDGASSAASEWAGAGGTEGLVGAMYTTWYDDYDQLEAWAEGWRQARGGERGSASTSMTR